MIDSGNGVLVIRLGGNIWGRTKYVGSRSLKNHLSKFGSDRCREYVDRRMERTKEELIVLSFFAYFQCVKHFYFCYL